MTTPTPECVALMAAATHDDCLSHWADISPLMHRVEDHLPYVRSLPAHPRRAADLRTAELAREWWARWEAGTQSKDYDDSARLFKRLTDHLRATEGGT